MQLQRYLLKRNWLGIYFGEHFREHSWDYEWFIGENRIGVTNNPSTEAECFIDSFLVRDDELIMIPSQISPRIERKSDQFGVMSGRSSGIKEVYDLIQLIRGQDTTHVCLTYENPEGGFPRILTFSTTAPPDRFYVSGKIMSVRIDEEALRLRGELEQRLL